MKTAMKIQALAIAGILLGAASAPALAGGRFDRDDGYFDRARVVDVKPIVEIVRVPDRHRECWTEETHGVRPSNATGSMVMGSIIGGVIGHQFGRGDGKRAATVAGTLIGAAVGRDVARQRAGEPYTVAEQRCRISHEYYEKERINGYRVTYRYHGQTYVTRTAEPPGKFIRVRVDVNPAWRGGRYDRGWHRSDYRPYDDD